MKGKIRERGLQTFGILEFGELQFWNFKVLSFGNFTFLMCRRGNIRGKHNKKIKQKLQRKGEKRSIETMH